MTWHLIGRGPDIGRIVLGTALLAAGFGSAGGAAHAQAPSFPCAKAAAGSIEEMVCGDRELSDLDRRLDDVYAQASRKAANEHPPVLKAEQRGWIKGRDDCWKSSDKRGCVRDSYRLRIAELQAEYRLVPATAHTVFACNGNPRDELAVTFFRTDPPTLIAERGDGVSLMYGQPAGGATSYRGRNESFREQDDTALVTWGYGEPEMRCARLP
ncbi:lysozyme inhibitor LprI family protein (plasmid) [Skermanella mucosa]|uniref:lysozyme inhibitor LprI family protein n=1 Tax=Skermanella mucosa TaxID=1789672 RepID=UPI00192C3345|nr:lysozyme inhibitor LprI family protein [Skermanella mucosa]UEM24625.1 lysozyme inhibitor LprI family protein [Skermanella mucosa]